jgi:hypothetical protein
MRLLRRVTIISYSGVIERVFYPIFPPDGHPADVVLSLTMHCSEKAPTVAAL